MVRGMTRKLPLTRSEVMSRIRGRDTRPELALRRLLHAAGLRFRVGLRCERSRPDVVFPRAKVAVFVDGCFWHGCPMHAVKPKTNAGFWSEKISSNKARDERQTAGLVAAGWIVLRYWEHEIEEDASKVSEAVRTALKNRQ